MFKPLTLGFTVLGFVLASGLPASGQSQDFSPTYTWHGELVAVDAAAGTITVKSRLVGTAMGEVKNLKAGQRVLLHWSGFDKTADAVWRVTAGSAEAAANDRFLFPVELVGPDVEHDYATVRFTAPSAALDQVRSLEPGTWVTVTARQRPGAEADAVVSLAPYVKEPAA